jgi:hypothetical protein
VLTSMLLVCRKWRTPAWHSLIKKISISSLEKLQQFLHRMILNGDLSVSCVSHVLTFMRANADGTTSKN